MGEKRKASKFASWKTRRRRTEIHFWNSIEMTYSTVGWQEECRISSVCMVKGLMNNVSGRHWQAAKVCIHFVAVTYVCISYGPCKMRPKVQKSLSILCLLFKLPLTVVFAGCFFLASFKDPSSKDISAIKQRGPVIALRAYTYRTIIG